MTQEEVHMVELIFYSLNIIALVGGGIIILLRMGRMMGAFETIGAQQATEIGEMKQELKNLNALITTVAVQKAEMASMQQQISLLTGWYDELRHGRGYVLNAAHSRVDTP